MADRRWDTELQEWVYPADWRPIETAPVGEELLAYDPKNKVVYIAYCDSQDRYWYVRDDHDHESVKPSHWMPLPDAPEMPNV